MSEKEKARNQPKKLILKQVTRAKGPRPEEVKTPLVSRGSFPHPNKHKERLNTVSLLVGPGVPLFQKIHPSVSLPFVLIGAWLFVILGSVT